MCRRGGRLLGVTAAIAGLVVLAVFTAPARSPAQSPPPPGASAALPAGYAGAEACKGCHEDQFNKFGETRMGRLFLKHPRNSKEQLACETCHGPGKAHVEAGGGKGVGNLISFAKDDKHSPAERNAVCIGCHNRGARLFWKGSTHDSRSVGCTTCHRIMESVSLKAQLAKPTEVEMCGTCHLERRAQTMRSSHMPVREGKMTCTSCHNPHGSVTPALLKENSLNETCYSCHAEKRGPFLWAHAPVPENCANCHDPHGSNHEKMLKVPKPRLCQQCHTGGGHPSNPYGPNAVSLRFVMGRQCTNCHVIIHGSNHPAGKFFER